MTPLFILSMSLWPSGDEDGFPPSYFAFTNFGKRVEWTHESQMLEGRNESTPFFSAFRPYSMIFSFMDALQSRAKEGILIERRKLPKRTYENRVNFVWVL